MKMVKVLIIGVVSATVIAVIIALCVTQTTQTSEAVETQQLGENALRGIVVFNVGTEKSGLKGTLILTQEDKSSPVRIQGKLSYLPANGKFGFHVHENGDIREGCKSAGGHFNPTKMEHGSPMDSMRHVGDLGNFESDKDGNANINVVDSHISLQGVNSIAGRAFVVHEKEDDLGQGGHPDSKKTGNAGSRIGCGIIGVIYPTK